MQTKTAFPDRSRKSCDFWVHFRASPDTVTYGPDGEGYTVSPEECTIDDKISFTQITCTVRPGIGTNHRWKVKTNKVDVSDASDVTTSYRPSVPYLIPTKITQGETARLT